MRLGEAEIGKRYVTVPTGRHITVTRKTGDKVWIKQDGSSFEIWINPDYKVEPESESQLLPDLSRSL